MTTESLCRVRDRLSEFVERVQSHHERVVITKNGSVAAVLVSAEDLAELEETLAVLSDPTTLAELNDAAAGVEAGDVVTEVAAIRSLRST